VGSAVIGGDRRGPNPLLRRHRLARCWSQQEVADRLLRIAAAGGQRGLLCTADQVGRWERGTRHPRFPYTMLLCDLYQVSAEQLGLIDDAVVVPSGRIDDVERRNFLRLGLGAAASLAVIDWQRIAAASADSRYVDSSAVADLRELTWEFGKRSHSMSPAALLPTTQDHLVRVQELARNAPGELRVHLVAVLGETAVVAGRLAYQLDNRGAAEAYYDLADRCALEAGEPLVRAQAYVGLSYLSSTVARGGAESDRRALILLDHARDASASGSPVLRAWILARRAEELAARGAAGPAHADMGAARAALEDRQVEHGLLSQWGQPWLAGYLANVHLLADEHDAAITVNREALAQLDEGLVYQRSALLSDVARAQAGQGDVDGACATLEEALALARRQGVEVRLQHVRRAREALPPAADTLAVRHLDEQLAVA